MNARKIRDRVQWLGVIDWNRRMFDALIPTPDGTSYNAYLVQGSEKTALLDTVDPVGVDTLMAQLANVPTIHYVVAHHAEQDHSGAIPAVLEKYPDAQVLCTVKAKELLIDHLPIAADRIQTVTDGTTVSLGDKTLQFIQTPWVHWPETMLTYLREDKILFTCDLFGAHFATSDLYAGANPVIYDAAKRYYAGIMMVYRKQIQNHLKKIQPLEFDLIAPSHGPLYDQPDRILEAYRDWTSDGVANRVVIPCVSMHGSTDLMVDHLVGALVDRGVKVDKFDLTVTDHGKLVMALIDAATIVFATPALNMGPHPLVLAATHLADALRPKLRYAAIIGSFGWGSKAPDTIAALIPNLKVEQLGTVMCKGVPKADTFAALDALADSIAAKHAALQTAPAPAAPAP
jgi:flavorubredoxin